jgi:hypothetical protein
MDRICETKRVGVSNQSGVCSRRAKWGFGHSMQLWMVKRYRGSFSIFQSWVSIGAIAIGGLANVQLSTLNVRPSKYTLRE